MEKAVTFTNYSDEDFSHTWDKVQYDFPKGQSTMLQYPLALHFGKHLAVRELNKKNVEYVTRDVIKKEMEKALSVSQSVEAEDTTKLTQKVLTYNEMSKDELKKVAKEKGLKIDGRKSAESIVKDLEEFEGAQEVKAE